MILNIDQTIGCYCLLGISQQSVLLRNIELDSRLIFDYHAIYTRYIVLRVSYCTSTMCNTGSPIVTLTLPSSLSSITDPEPDCSNAAIPYSLAFGGRLQTASETRSSPSYWVRLEDDTFKIYPRIFKLRSIHSRP